MGLDNPIHLVLLLVVLLLVFGAKRLPEMGRSLGDGLRGFKEAVNPDGATVHAETATDTLTAATPTAPVTAVTPATTIAPEAEATQFATVSSDNADA